MSKRIALATIALNGMPGGLERNITYLANHLSGKGFDVHLLTFDLPEATVFYRLDDRVTWHKLGTVTPHERIGFRERALLILRIRKILSAKPSFHCVVCFHHGLLVRYFLATLFCRVRIICSERHSLTIYDHTKSSKWNKNFLLLFLINRITVQFPNYVQDYPWLLRSKIKVVHNPVFPADSPSSDEREKLILSVGRHSAQKRFDLLIRACRIVFRKHPDWRLAIVGDGPLTPSLQHLIAQLSLGEHVELISPVADLHPLFSRSRFYCQPSQWEGFPNAQAEAMAAGVIPIGFACSSGVANLIVDGVNGYLCLDAVSAENLAKTIVIAIEAKHDRKRLSEKARLVSEVYSVESWVQSWKETLYVSCDSPRTGAIGCENPFLHQGDE